MGSACQSQGRQGADRRFQLLDGGHAADRGGQRAHERHPDLHGGEEAVRVLLEAQGRRGPTVPFPGEAAQPRGPRAHHGDLRPGEEAVQQDQEADQDQLDQEAVVAHDPFCPRGRRPPTGRVPETVRRGRSG
jgi:hypothetical protein